MRGQAHFPLVLVFMVGAVAGGGILLTSQRDTEAVAAPQPPGDLAALTAEVERLKGMVPDQAHAMADVGYHYANLWFAGQHENWPLAEFCGNEVKSHMRWAVRIIPVRKDAAGREVDLKGILDAIEGSSFKDVEEAVKAKDKPRFEAAYRVMLESCISCHQASGKPFIRPHVPDAPEARILDFEPLDAGQ